MLFAGMPYFAPSFTRSPAFCAFRNSWFHALRRLLAPWLNVIAAKVGRAPAGYVNGVVIVNLPAYFPFLTALPIEMLSKPTTLTRPASSASRAEGRSGYS